MVGEEAIFEHLQLTKEGWLIGPNESEDSFFQRIKRSEIALEYPFTRLKKLFDVDPKFFPIVISNKGLRFYEGGATWPKTGRVQIRAGKRLGYDAGEALCHESVHMARQAFDEGRLEELFAYMTSEKRWKQLVGPLFTYWWDLPLLLLLSFISPALLAFYLWIQCSWIAYLRFLISKAANRFHLSLLLRMTFKEIRALATLPFPRAENFFLNQKGLRWEIIKTLYNQHKKERLT